MNSTEGNKAAVRACFENAAQGNFDALDDILTAEYVLHPEEVRGAEGLKEMVQRYRDALSGLRVAIDHQFVDGDYVATRYTITGTHDGDLMEHRRAARTLRSPVSRSVAVKTGASPKSGRSRTRSRS